MSIENIVNDEYKLTDLVRIRYGHYIKKNMLLSRMMVETQPELRKIKELNTKIKQSIEELIDGKNNREEIKELRKELEKAKHEYRFKASPILNQIAIRNKVISFLDKKLIPLAYLRETGEPITPSEEVEPFLKKALGL